jgi:hypothetical protein
MPVANPAQARSFAAGPHWGRGRPLGLVLAQEAALGPLGAFLVMLPIVSSPVSSSRTAPAGAGTR